VVSGSVAVEVEVTLRLTVNQSVSQYVELSSPLWDLWPDITFCPKVDCLKVAILSLRGALSDWDLWPDITFCPKVDCLKVAILSLRGALSDEKSGLSIVILSL
jgi:DNA-binding winged helix-turn-helix (wHTH) protein